MDSQVNVGNDPFMTHSAVVHGQEKRGGRNRKPPSAPDLTHVAFVPTAIVCIISSAFAFVYPFFWFLPWLLVFLCVLMVPGLQQRSQESPKSRLGMRTMGSWQDGTQGRNGAAPSSLPVLMGACAIALGLITGLTIYGRFTWQFFSLVMNPWYHDALASNPGATYGDAGAIEFSKSSMVDTTMALGFKKGSTYCVAPVGVDLSPSDGVPATVNFWAVGKDCCGARGSFWCGGAGDVSSRYALQEPPRGWLSNHDLDFYEQAIRQAEVVYTLKSESSAMLVRWVDGDPNIMKWFCLYCAVAAVLTATFCFLIVGIVIALLVVRAADKPAEKPAGAQGR